MNREQAIRAVATRLIAEPTFHGDSPLLAAELIGLAVQSSDDPVREAAQALIRAWREYEIKTYTAKGQACLNRLDAALSADKEAKT